MPSHSRAQSRADDARRRLAALGGLVVIVGIVLAALFAAGLLGSQGGGEGIERVALLDTTCSRRMTYAEYGATVERLARGLVASGLRAGEIVAIYLPNSWEFCAAFHAAQLAGAAPTPLNPQDPRGPVRIEGTGGQGVIIRSPTQ